MIMGIILLVGAAACAKAPALALVPTEAPQQSPTPAPTATKDPFKGLSICRTWQEAENCPIRIADFERLPDFVKTNFIFPPEAMRVKQVFLQDMGDRTSYVSIHALTEEEIINGTATATESTENKDKEFIFGGSLSPIGKPYFFMLKKNSSLNNTDCWIAVFPVNNADGSIGTYTIIIPSFTVNGDEDTPEEWTKSNLVMKFEKMPFLPPVYKMGWIPISCYGAGSRESLVNQGSFIDSILINTNNPNGTRRKLFNEWEETAIIPEELEKIPLFGSNMTLNGGFQSFLE
jgi:hypothetical protein